MPSEPLVCPLQAELSNAVQAILARIVHLTTAALQSFQSRDHAGMMRLDKQLETAMGEKERAIGALNEHRREHGC